MRNINKEEAEQLREYFKKWFPSDDEYDTQMRQDFVNQYWFGVIDKYISDCPGYAGKLIVCVYGYPEAYEILCERDGKLEHLNSEMHEKDD